ncbi:zinc-dependent metalloprotease [Aeoliella mucimassa]|uniref:zinc-dependent metalloprotease n=1 Tax=Aeoliella mucimassa TaxID=2527972 RepID=UPI001E36FE33|nr:zinc-dependent metalloprotease [Aeoliella mucimassa]
MSLSYCAQAAADDQSDEPTQEQQTEITPDQISSDSGQGGSSSSSSRSSGSSSAKFPEYSKVLKDTSVEEGLIKLHKGEEKLFFELKPSDLDKDFFVLITIAKGIGQRPLLGGYSWGFGDDWVWQFRRVGDRIHIVRRNVRFVADKGSPSAEAVKLSYSDSVLYSLPIATTGPGGSIVLDMTPVLMSDLPQIGQVLSGFSFSPSKSNWADVQAHPKNVEVQVAATYASNGSSNMESVPDTRGVTVNVHYSISNLPKTNYTPRLADDRIGYFLTVVKDYSKKESEDRFVRYINRWNLEKSDPSAEKSPPKEPIVFWLEKTIPFKYRKPIRDGIEEWNKAYEEAGFYNAIEVRQQPDDATWEPGDVRYNTFRWITAGAGFAMGPSRVDPTTGQILDADIIFDSDFLQSWKREYETFTPESIAAMTGGPLEIEDYLAMRARQPSYLNNGHQSGCMCNLLGGMSMQFAKGAAVVSTRKRSSAELDKMILQGLKEVAMHEVGHTLGLRHNFKSSTLYSMDELHDVSKTSKTGLTGSVMDYNPTNLAPMGQPQGDYYSTTIGPYDHWAIEYGYKPIKGSKPEDELEELGKIAARSGEPNLVYSTDEDTRGIDPDPHSNRFDFSDNLIEYAQQEVQVVAETMPSIVDELVEDGEGYERARRAFGLLLSSHGKAVFFTSRYVGGVYVSRSHKGDANAPAPLELVPAERQREALKFVCENMFSAEPFNFSPEIYDKLAASHWSHWGVSETTRYDYPAHDAILMWQERVLEQLTSGLTLERIHDSELKTSPDTDMVTVAELLTSLTDAMYQELNGNMEGTEFTARKPAISSLRRNIQRSYLDRLVQLALGTSAPADCQTMAYSELGRLKGMIDKFLEANGEKLDRYSQAHLEETSARIERVMDSRFEARP